ncbi:RDD family protein [Glycomyces salinus]|uniref:RDD family protein n=1 Tax=Glycomyces salinus TaxID=980294 RepID=UPI0018ED594E|nr:RDD family protein [Glycomyces salinus]
MTKIEPGWYPDPADHAVQRYWNGSAWVGKPVPADAEPPAEPEPVDPAPEPDSPESAKVEGATVAGMSDFPDGPPQIIQRRPGMTQPPDTVPIRSLGITVGWLANKDVDRILAGRVLAHPGTRLVARLVDFLCLLGLNAVVNGYFLWQFMESLWPAIQQTAQGAAADEVRIPDSVSDNYWIAILIGLGLWFAYEVPATLNSGQTIGKRLMGIRVEPIGPVAFGWGRMLLRWSYMGFLMICFPFGLIFWVLDGIWCIRDRPFHQCLHDKSPGTVVVEVPREKEPDR